MKALNSQIIEKMRERLEVESDPVLKFEVNLFDREQRELSAQLAQKNRDDFQFVKLSKSLKQNMNQKQFFIFLGIVCKRITGRTFFNENNEVSEYVGNVKSRTLTREQFVIEFGAK